MAVVYKREFLSQNLKYCFRCISSFSNQMNMERYPTNMKDCGSCLGIMADDCVNETIEKVKQVLKKKHYECEDYSLAIKIPQSFLLRQKSMKAFFNQHEGFISHKDFRTLKEELRQTIVSKLSKEINKQHNSQSELLVNVIFKYENDDREIERLNSVLPNPSNKARKRKYFENQRQAKSSHSQPTNSIQIIEQVLENINDYDIHRFTPCPPQSIGKPCTIEVNVCQGSIFFAGRYNKYSRSLSQTPWILDGVRKTESSVQELICEKLQQHTSGSGIRFLSAGREDVDVRMLGKGRPFAVEIIDPSVIHLSKEKIGQLQQEINDSTDLVAVQDLSIISRDHLTLLKKGEEEKVKRYRAKLWCQQKISEEKLRKLNNMSEFVLHQKTPIRVLHRRPVLTRDKVIHKINITKDDDIHYTMNVTTQAGTYIKEFVHSDFGRTVPSLQSILDADIDIIELDVEHIELDWPPNETD